MLFGMLPLMSGGASAAAPPIPSDGIINVPTYVTADEVFNGDIHIVAGGALYIQTGADFTVNGAVYIDGGNLVMNSGTSATFYGCYVYAGTNTFQDVTFMGWQRAKFFGGVNTLQGCRFDNYGYFSGDSINHLYDVVSLQNYLLQFEGNAQTDMHDTFINARFLEESDTLLYNCWIPNGYVYSGNNPVAGVSFDGPHSIGAVDISMTPPPIIIFGVGGIVPQHYGAIQGWDEFGNTIFSVKEKTSDCRMGLHVTLNSGENEFQKCELASASIKSGVTDFTNVEFTGWQTARFQGDSVNTLTNCEFANHAYFYDDSYNELYGCDLTGDWTYYANFYGNSQNYVNDSSVMRARFYDHSKTKAYDSDLLMATLADAWLVGLDTSLTVNDVKSDASVDGQAVWDSGASYLELHNTPVNLSVRVSEPGTNNVFVNSDIHTATMDPGDVAYNLFIGCTFYGWQTARFYGSSDNYIDNCVFDNYARFGGSSMNTVYGSTMYGLDIEGAATIDFQAPQSVISGVFRVLADGATISGVVDMPNGAYWPDTSETVTRYYPIYVIDNTDPANPFPVVGAVVEIGAQTLITDVNGMVVDAAGEQFHYTFDGTDYGTLQSVKVFGLDVGTLNFLTDTPIIYYGAGFEPPVADAGLDQVLNTKTVDFDGSGSYDPDGTIVSWEWDFGDESSGTGETTNHPYAADGAYTVTLTVTDNRGFTDTDTCEIFIDSTFPAITITSPLTADPAYRLPGETLTVEYDYVEENPLSVTIYIMDGFTPISFESFTTGFAGGVGSNTITIPAAIPDGAYNLMALMTDTVGNSWFDLEAGALTIDTLDPWLDITSPTMAAPELDVVPGDTITVTYDWTEANPDKVIVTIYDPALTPILVQEFTSGFGSHEVVMPDTSDGWHHLRVEMVDKMGRSYPDAELLSIEVDTLGKSMETIEELPDAAFDKNPGQRRNSLLNKLGAVENQVAEGNYQDAINKLQNDVRVKMDGSVGGNPKNDWITDPGAQAELTALIDRLVSILQSET